MYITSNLHLMSVVCLYMEGGPLSQRCLTYCHCACPPPSLGFYTRGECTCPVSSGLRPAPKFNITASPFEDCHDTSNCDDYEFARVVIVDWVSCSGGD